jgi:hypothetical protein
VVDGGGGGGGGGLGFWGLGVSCDMEIVVLEWNDDGNEFGEEVWEEKTYEDWLEKVLPICHWN